MELRGAVNIDFTTRSDIAKLFLAAFLFLARRQLPAAMYQKEVRKQKNQVYIEAETAAGPTDCYGAPRVD